MFKYLRTCLIQPIYFLLLTVVLIIGASNKTIAQGVNIYASPIGVDTGNGFSLSTAVNIKRATLIAKNYSKDAVTIWLADGVYSSVSLDSTNSRSSTTPVIYKAINRGKAIFEPIINLSTTAFQPIPDSIKSRIIDSTAKDKVKQLPLAALKLRNMNTWPNSFGVANLTALKFYNNGMVLPMSRYPKDSNMTMKKVLANGTGGKMPGGTFIYRNNRCKYWVKEINDAGLYLSGAWRVPWQIDVVKTQLIDTIGDSIQQVVGVSGGIGDKYSRPAGNGKEPYWAINLVEEISMPGEWSINFRTKMLYMWLPDSATIQVASDPTLSAISLSGVKNTSFIGISIIGGAGDGFTLNNCSNIKIGGCEIANCSGNAVTITGGKSCTVQSCTIHSIGGSGVKIESANYNSDQKNVTLCNHQVINNHIYTVGVEKQVYYPSIDISTAIGAYVAHNLLNDAPQICIYFGGNSNIIEYNEAYNVANKYGGASAFYRTGNFADRGNKVRYNYIHESPLSGGVSEDNWGSGDSIYYNIIANTFLGTNNNGGFADVLANNIYINNVPAHSSAIERDTTANYKKFYANLQTIYNSSAAYRAAYPDAAAMLDTLNKANKAFKSLQWNQFNCNVLINNSQVFWGIKDTAFFNTNGTQKTSSTLATAPAFKNYGTVVHDNYKINGRLTNSISPFRIDSLKSVAAFNKTCGKDWHINRIGLYVDEFRTFAGSSFTKGVSPKIVWQKNSVQNDTAIVIAIIKNPNVANCISSWQFYLDSAAVTPLSSTTTSISYDTLLLKAVFTGLTEGNHSVSSTIFDTPNWKYSSGLDTFTISQSLPIYVTSLTGNVDDCTVNLHWHSKNENNINKYEVQQSNDGTAFQTIKTILPKGIQANNIYNLTLNQSATPASYFRLKITDLDGEIRFSNVVSLKVNCSDIVSFIAYPNPTNNILHINYTTNSTIQNGQIVLTDINGKQVINLPSSFNKGKNEMSINLKSIPFGTYLLLLKDSNGILAQKTIVKTR